jgi:DNA-binding MarR family transcriptional regulator/RimJ/RimL family protein N-acetyltransferase
VESGIEERVESIRAFNRFYTREIGVLEEGLLQTPYSLTEARVLYELGQRDDTEVTDLRATTELDAGYLSRILARFETDGLIARRRSTRDGRRQVARLTSLGQSSFQTLDSRSAREIRDRLDVLSEAEQKRLLEAIVAIRSVLDGARSDDHQFVLRSPGPGDFGWVIARHGTLYAAEYGWDASFEALVARVVAEYIDTRDPKRDAAWIADVNGEPAGCIFCVRKTDRIAQLRLLLVEPSARGMGVGSRLVDECIAFARRAGYEQIVLWTNDVLVEARRIYERSGFRLQEEERHHSFGIDLVGQNWALDL